MKQLHKFLCILLVIVNLCASAQNKENYWLIGIGTHAANMSFGDDPSNYFKNWNVVPALSQIKFIRHIKAGLSLGTQFSFGTAKRGIAELESNEFFFQWGIDLKYSFANGYILKEKSWFDPYFIVGGGLNKWGDTKGSINAGAGINLWVVKNFGFFFQSVYNYLPHGIITPNTNDARPSFLHHSFGAVVRLGRGRDTDKDGIPDANDKCPNVPGKPELGGCPDTDGDGIIDKDDKCPMVAGILLYQGCPDTDGDGIMDAEDDCPNEKGTIEMKGCPDKDGDGINDKNDKCPTEKGPATTLGCPDRDGDGIPDKEDACPDQKGSIAAKGCPDSDGDGILDKDDKCPNVYGVAENFGCPKPAIDATEKMDVQKKLSLAAKNIFFEPNKEVLKPESIGDLNQVVITLKQYDFLRVSIDGHTDNTGSESSNLDLSNKRAAVVMNYLAAHGITPTRLSAAGYGSSRPIADNKTPSGKAKNRRVEINIKD